MSDNIVLIGFMGVGKGQIARILATMTNRYAVDSDDLIESLTNKKIKKIFSTQGEKAFRELEKRTAKWLEHNVRSSIVSTGGGFVNLPKLKTIGTIVYLHAEFSYIIKSLKKHENAEKKIKKRPLLQDLQEAENLYNIRVPLYTEVADFKVVITNKDIYSVASEICGLCNLVKNKESFGN